MTFEDIRKTVEVRMAAWATAKTISVAYDNVKPSFDTAALDKWVRCTIIDGDSFTAGIGSDPCVRRVGLVSMQIFTRRDKGSLAAREIATSLASHWEYYQSGGFSTQAARLINVGPDDNYYQLNLQVGFTAD